MGDHLFTKGGKRFRVRRLGEFNISLLGKWCWRKLVEKDGLWYQLLKARYGEEGTVVGGGKAWFIVVAEYVSYSWWGRGGCG